MAKEIKRLKSELQLVKSNASPPESAPDPRDAWVLDAGYNRHLQNLSALARQLDKNRYDCKAGIKSTAMAWITAVIMQLDELDEELFDGETPRIPILWVCTKLMWDEASTQMAIAMSSLISSVHADCIEAQHASWPIMQSRRRLRFQRRDERPRTFETACPPVLLLGKVTADCFYVALYLQKIAKRFEALAIKMRRCIEVAALDVGEADDDARNRRLGIWLEQSPTLHGALRSQGKCSLHNNGKTVKRSNVVMKADLDVHGPLYSHGKLMRMGHLQTRCLLALPVVATTHLGPDSRGIIRATPPAVCTRLRTIVVAHLWPELYSYKGRSPTAKSIERNTIMKDEYLAVNNNHPFAPMPGHYCQPGICTCGIGPRSTSSRWAASNT